MSRGIFGDLIGSIDEGTSSARFVLFKAGTADIVCFHQMELRQITPAEGWVEQDAEEILRVVEICIGKTVEKLITLGGFPSVGVSIQSIEFIWFILRWIYSQDIVAVGVTNQRETTVVWSRQTGKPLHNAILWLDVRTSATVDELVELLPGKNRHHYQKLTGLPLSTYFSGVKMRWLKDNVPDVMKALDDNDCLFGTIDTWLIWNLTGGLKNGVHVTDVTNASRTMLMNIDTCKWEPELLEFFGVPPSILPEIRSSSEVYGTFASGPLEVLRITHSMKQLFEATAAPFLLWSPCVRQRQSLVVMHKSCSMFLTFVLMGHWMRLPTILVGRDFNLFLHQFKCNHFSLQDCPLSGCLGDQQAALVGQQCLAKGQAKATYGTGCFLLYNTGTRNVTSTHGLLSTLAYQFGPDASPHYALEGSVAIAGAAITWVFFHLKKIT